MPDRVPSRLTRALRLASLLAVLAVPPPAAADTSVQLADGSTLQRVRLRPGGAPDQVLLERAGDAPVVVAPQEMLVVDFGKIPGRAMTPTVRMTNGDQVYGKVTFPSARRVKVAAGWGSVTIPLSACSAIRLAEKAPLPAPVARDTVILAGDRVEGEIQGVAAGKVTLNLAGRPLGVDLARVSALALASRARSGEGPGGLLVLLDLGGGERLTGRWVGLAEDVLTVRLEWGDTLDVPVASLSRLEVKNGKLVYLSDLKPAEFRHVPYLDGAFSLRVDQAVSGRPLRLGGRTYSRGLGMHSRSEAVYALDGGFQTFAATVGIDDAVGGEGSVVFRIFGDDKPLFESPVIRGGEGPLEIKVNLKGVLLLRLEVDYADNGDAADHADWAEARLLRE